MSNERNKFELHDDGDAKKEQRITRLKDRVNQIKQKYPEDTATRKTMETVVKPTENIYLEFKADNAKKVEEHKSMLDDFQL